MLLLSVISALSGLLFGLLLSTVINTRNRKKTESEIILLRGKIEALSTEIKGVLNFLEKKTITTNDESINSINSDWPNTNQSMNWD